MTLGVAAYVTASGECYIFDPSLVDASGHHLHANLALRQTLSAMGFTCTAFANNKADAQVIDAGFVPHFAHRAYRQLNRIYRDPHPDVTEATKGFTAELSATGIDIAGGGPCLLFPTVMHFHMTGIGRWLEDQNLSGHPAVIIWILFSTDFSAGSDAIRRFAHDRYVEAIKALDGARRKGARIGFVFDTPDMFEPFSGLAEFPMMTARPVSSYTRAAERHQSAVNSGGDRRLAYLGHTSRDKGFLLLPDILPAVWRQHNTTRITIQVNVAGPVDPYSETIKRLQAMDDRVVLEFGPLAPERYRTLLSEADLILMPYSPEAYANRGSGIYAEAEDAGIPVVAPASAAFARAGIAAGACAGFDTHTAEDIGSAIIRTLDNLAAMKEAAAKQAGALPSVKAELETMLRRLGVADTAESRR